MRLYKKGVFRRIVAPSRMRRAAAKFAPPTAVFLPPRLFIPPIAPANKSNFCALPCESIAQKTSTLLRGKVSPQKLLCFAVRKFRPKNTSALCHTKVPPKTLLRFALRKLSPQMLLRFAVRKSPAEAGFCTVLCKSPTTPVGFPLCFAKVLGSRGQGGINR